MALKEGHIPGCVPFVVLRVNINIEHKVLLGKVLGCLEVAICGDPMNRGITAHIPRIETPTFLITLLKRFEFPLLSRQVDIFIIFYKTANAFRL